MLGIRPVKNTLTVCKSFSFELGEESEKGSFTRKIAVKMKW